MFKKQDGGGDFKEIETVIGSSVKVKGNFHGKGNIIVEGTLEGNLKTEGNVLIGDNAKITASIEAKNIKVGGKINGNVKCQGYLEVGSSAKIFGDVECSTISIEKGAQINGKYTMANRSNETISKDA